MCQNNNYWLEFVSNFEVPILNGQFFFATIEFTRFEEVNFINAILVRSASSPHSANIRRIVNR
jgi:hypothetical protein